MILTFNMTPDTIFECFEFRYQMQREVRTVGSQLHDKKRILKRSGNRKLRLSLTYVSHICTFDRSVSRCIPPVDIKTRTTMADEKKKGVKFHSRDSINEVLDISGLCNYTEDELDATWGDDLEHQLRKEELRQATIEFRQGRRASDNLTFTTKGIADKVGQGRMMKKMNRALSRQAVMDVQDFQDMEGDTDDKLIASVYSSTTLKARLKAQKEAEDMADEVKRINEEG